MKNLKTYILLSLLAMACNIACNSDESPLTEPLYFNHFFQGNYRYEPCKIEEEEYYNANISSLRIEQFEGQSLTYSSGTQSPESLLISGRREAEEAFTDHAIKLRTFDYKGVDTYLVGKSDLSNEDWDASLVVSGNIIYASYDLPSGNITITEDCET